MKRIFTFLATAFVAFGIHAETLIDFSQSQAGITVSGSTEITTVKIKTNSTAVDCIKFQNGYTTEGECNGNYAELSVEGGFKTGDVITVAGAFNNSDDTKQAAIAIFTLDGTKPTVLYTTAQLVNGRLSDDNPVAETYTLTEDVEKIYLGRKGNTGTCVTTLTVVRGEASSVIDDEPEETSSSNGLIDYPTKTDGITIGGTTEYSTVKIKTNSTSVDCIKFKNGYTTEGECNGNYAELYVEGGFKVGDVISIAGAFNNDDDTKQSAVAIFTLDGTKPTVLYTTEQFVNGRLSDNNPVVETYTLTADVDKLYLGRKGNTGTCVTLLTVERGVGTGIENLPVVLKNNGAVYNLNGQRVNDNTRGIVIMNGKKVVK